MAKHSRSGGLARTGRRLLSRWRTATDFLDRRALAKHVSSPQYVQTVVDLFSTEWATRLPIEGVVSGGSDLFPDPRLKWAIRELGGVEGKSVLELGPLEGAHTHLLENAGASTIVSVEANGRAYLKCLVVQELFKLKRANFVLGDCVDFLQATDAKFDLVVAHGILYHLINPAALIARIAKISPRITLLREPTTTIQFTSPAVRTRSCSITPELLPSSKGSATRFTAESMPRLSRFQAFAVEHASIATG